MTREFKHGLVVGKFCPPHAGHVFVIETAAASCEKVTVLVCDNPAYPIPAGDRARWLNEMLPYPSIDIRIIKDLDDDENSEAWAAYTLNFLLDAPDAIFSSEHYGDRYATAVGATHVCVDRTRETRPISATQIRTNPAECWEFLSPAVRAHYVERIVVLGAESTGTTTLSRALAQRWDCLWVPEYGRLLSEAKLSDGTIDTWISEEFVEISLRQAELEEQAARVTQPKDGQARLVCDTDPLATILWHQRYMGFEHPQLRDLAESRRYRLYVLTGDEIPFAQDGLRDGEHIRHQMHQNFRALLASQLTPWVEVFGSVSQRIEQVEEALAALPQIDHGATAARGHIENGTANIENGTGNIDTGCVANLIVPHDLALIGVDDLARLTRLVGAARARWRYLLIHNLNAGVLLQ
jgi:NadR type nicotinamide-nucleotide adenylyltransferase